MEITSALAPSAELRSYGQIAVPTTFVEQKLKMPSKPSLVIAMSMIFGCPSTIFDTIKVSFRTMLLCLEHFITCSARAPLLVD
jgi:hypothetical protein